MPEEGDAEIPMIARVRTWCATGEAKRIREEAHLTKAELGRLAGATGPAVSRWECGARRPQGAHALRYYRALMRLRQLTKETQPGAA